jgi:hypothetical protein
VKTKPTTPLKKARVTVVRHSSVAPDYDGLVSGAKSVIDGLVECGVLEDDSLAHIGMPSFSWEKCKKGEGRLTITIEETHD